jgi:glycosyltransferase involved in cell wall biosynthesis
MKILFLILYPASQPSPRFRVMQFLPFLPQGSIPTVKSAVPAGIFNRCYSHPRLLGRIIFHLVEFFYRLFWILTAFRYDVVFVQKALTTIHYRFFDTLLFTLQKNVVFDFDDAITIESISQVTKFPWVLLTDDRQHLKIIGRARRVIVGNEKLRGDIESFNPHVVVIPTPVDTVYYQAPAARYERRGEILIFWSGNQSSHNLFRLCAPAVVRLALKYSVKMMILSDIETPNIVKWFCGISYEFIRWSYDNEKRAFDKADIGIMPLTDTLWNRRKCAFKALLYMANGIPCVSSPVGIINDIITDGENGLLANSDEEWYGKLERLILNAGLREKIGSTGRKAIEEKFSLKRWESCWNETIRMR